MDTSVVPAAISPHSALATRLIAAAAALVDAHDFVVDELRASTHDAVVAVTFALSGLPRGIVDDGIGEVFFNEDTSITDRGGCDGDLVAMIGFDARYAVLDAARGYADSDADHDAYLNGVGYVFGSEREARGFAEVCALKVRRRAVAAALRRGLELASPMSAEAAAAIVGDAFEDENDPQRRAWLHEVRRLVGQRAVDSALQG